MKITDVKIIVCSPGRNFVTVKIFTDEGLTGVGDATLNGREKAVVAYLQDHLVPLLIGLGFAYHFSRRTYLFVMGTLVKNGYSAVYNNSNQQSPNPGEDVRQIGVGIHTAF